MRMLFAAALAFLVSCGPQQPETKTGATPLPGVWHFAYDLGEVSHTQTVELSPQNEFIFFNGLEQIRSEGVEQSGDTLRILLPIYGTYIEMLSISDSLMAGFWVNPSKTDYRVPVSAQRGKREHHLPAPPGPETLTFSCVFSEGTDGAYPAEGLFTLSGTTVYGTFRTETGDYRYLEGTARDGAWAFGCFDGSHLFHFTATVVGDSINGKFYSGTHWQEPFSGYRTNGEVLRDPFTITKVINDAALAIPITNALGERSTFDSSSYKGKVYVIQIMGTWCPNCLDESRYLTELANTYDDTRLGIAGFAFERKGDDALRIKEIERYRKTAGISYPIYLSGNASKGEAAEAFPMLSGFSSFPTTLVLDKEGRIALVHTGFNGPGTGHHYTQFRGRFEAVIDSLIALD